VEFGEFSLQEGTLSIGYLVLWWGRSFPTTWRLDIGVSHPLIYFLATSFNGLEAISLEIEFLGTYS
jgi:hypothetical protein